MSRQISRAFLARLSVLTRPHPSLAPTGCGWPDMSSEVGYGFPEISASEAQRLASEWFPPESGQADASAFDSERLGQLRCLSTLEAAGVDCRSLPIIGIKKLNDVFRQLAVPQSVRKLVKRRRRVIKNRGYARDRRDRVSAEESRLISEIDELRRQTRQVEALHRHLESLPPSQLEEVLRDADGLEAAASDGGRRSS